jgi:hypothetical protein
MKRARGAASRSRSFSTPCATVTLCRTGSNVFDTKLDPFSRGAAVSLSPWRLSGESPQSCFARSFTWISLDHSHHLLFLNSRESKRRYYPCTNQQLQLEMTLKPRQHLTKSPLPTVLDVAGVCAAFGWLKSF